MPIVEKRKIRESLCQRTTVGQDALVSALGIAQRRIKAQRVPDSGIIRNRKPLNCEPQTLGQCIRYWRKVAGLTRRQMAATTRIPRHRNEGIEREKLSLGRRKPPESRTPSGLRRICVRQPNKLRQPR